MGLFKWIVIPVVIASIVWYFMADDPVPPEMVDSWWGRNIKPLTTEDASIRTYVVNAELRVLKDLQDRIKNSRLPESLDDTETFEYGFNSRYLKEVLDYWSTKYNWEKQQAIINDMKQFITKIEGIDVHFVRVTPTNYSGRKRAILAVHGWPGSFLEFYKLIPLLTDGKKDGDIAFEVVCPSIPGYGFSEAPHKQGFDVSAAARIFYKLMTRLGHEKFYVHGGDWGGVISTIIAQAYPRNVVGIHVNMFFSSFSSSAPFLKQLIGEFLPSLIYTSAELPLVLPMQRMWVNILQESGYMHLQSTKPDTVGVGLTDSPAGLAAYILEKFSTWSAMENRNCSDGCITKYFTMDEVLTNVMIYWLSENVASSMRFYKEFFRSTAVQQWDNVPVIVPSGIAAFPNELILLVRSIAELKYKNVIHYTNMPRGGHFAAFEEPHLMANDIKTFVRAVEKLDVVLKE